MAIAAVWLLMKVPDAQFWPTTLILYGPRWVVAVPLLVLLPVAIILRRGLKVLSGSLVVLVGPLLGLCVPLRLAAFEAGAAQGPICAS